MDRRQFISGGVATGGSIASLLALTDKPHAQALIDFTNASHRGGGAVASTDYLQVDPQSPSFQSLIRGFNGRWSAPNARMVYIPLTEQGVVSAVAAVQAAGLGRNFTVRGGGHCYEDFVFNPQVQAIIDVSLLKAVGYDNAKGVYYAQAGATNYDLQAGLIRFGKTLPGGSCWTVGLGGHVVGGGYGLLSRQYGLVVDWLTGVSLVHLRDGGPKPINVGRNSSGSEADLFWAHTGGGGGNFGIITRYEFAQLPNAPANAEIVNIAWNWSDIKNNGGSDYLTRIVHCFESLASSLGNTAFVILKLTHQDSKQLQIVIQDVKVASPGTLAQQVKTQLNTFGVSGIAPTLSSIAGHPFQGNPVSEQQYTWWEAVYALSGSGGPWNGKYKSAYMRSGFTDADIKKIYQHLTLPMAVSMENSLVQVDSYGGMINTISRNATAVWQRDSIFKLQYQTYWPILEDQNQLTKYQNANLQWIRDFYADIYASSGGIPDPNPISGPNPQVDGCYINYPDVDLNQFGLKKALQLYYGGNLPRLMQTKLQWEPQNIFNHAQSIRAL